MRCRSYPGYFGVIALILFSGSPAGLAAGEPWAIGRALPDQLGQFRASGDLKQVSASEISQIAPEHAAVLQEYGLGSAAARDYGALRVEVFELPNHASAVGLFTFHAGGRAIQVGNPDPAGQNSAKIDDAFFLVDEQFVVRLTPTQAGRVPASGQYLQLARAVAAAIPPGANPGKEATLLDHLPADGLIGRPIYAKGPEVLGRFVEHSREMFPFPGDAAAAIGYYSQGDGSAQTPPLKLLIVEYHTPQFATDAMEQLSGVLATLSEEEQSRMIIKREGNYILEASSFLDRQQAQSLIDSIEYPYTVKWLRNPLWPTNDPFRTQKAAQMLLSTFGLLGVLLMTVAAGGAIFGTTVFLRRRKQQRRAFSDAGGMLRLELDPFDGVILGLPAKRDED
jgi:hypothetical protein